MTLLVGNGSSYNLWRLELELGFRFRESIWGLVVGNVTCLRNTTFTYLPFFYFFLSAWLHNKWSPCAWPLIHYIFFNLILAWWASSMCAGQIGTTILTYSHHCSNSYTSFGVVWINRFLIPQILTLRLTLQLLLEDWWWGKVNNHIKI